MDRISDTECDNITDAACAPALSERQRLARVVAIEVAIVPRTRRELDLDPTTPPVVQNHTIADYSDKYRRWVYRTVVKMRNNAL